MRDTYWRRARVEKVVDGDTIQVDIDLGFYTSVVHRLRLLGVDTPEVNSRDADERARAQAAMAFTSAWLAEHAAHAQSTEWPFNMRTEKADSFGRFLADVECGQGHNLNTALLDTGHAKPYVR
jgi:micrococcal nuclease